jgi:hypothetical protein
MDDKELREYLDLQLRDTTNDFRELEAALLGDINDAVEATVPTDQVVRVPVPKRMGVTPNSYVIIDQDGVGSLVRRGDTLVVRDTMVFDTDAEPGTMFVVVPIRR